MPKLYFADNDQLIGEISKAQLEFLKDHLEEEDAEDRDYYINKDTLDMLEEDGCEAELLSQLKQALADHEEMDVRWSE